MDYNTFFTQSLNTIKEDGRYRTFVSLERLCGQAPYALWHKEDGSTERVIVFCSNDYLGMSQHPDVLEAFHNAADTYGVGSGGTRNISGTSKAHVDLERKVAELHGKEAGLLFSSGYTANKASLHILGSQIPECVIFSDEKNHASMIHGIRHSRTEKRVFKHNDMHHLEQMLQSYPLERPKIIAFVSVYSMDGDFAPIQNIIYLAKKYNALTFLDEVHAVGIYGPWGAGLAAAEGLTGDIDIIQANFAKGYGVVGGYIASQSNLVDFVRSFAPGFIFTTSIPPAVAAACLKSVEVQQYCDDYRRQLFANVFYLKEHFEKSGVGIVQNDSHIIPIRVGDALKCKELSDRLLTDYGLYIQPINFPTVPLGEERLRITVTPQHTKEHMDCLIQALSFLWKELKLQKAA